jgi:hypothetical protein
MPVILATQEAEIGRIMVRSQARQIVHETLAQKKQNKTKTSKRAGEMTQRKGPEFKPQCHK